MAVKLHPHLKWNDGEGLVYTDLSKANSYLYRQVLEAISLISGAQMGAAMSMAYSAATGIDPFNAAGSERSNLDSDKLYIPHAMNGVVIPNNGQAPSSLIVGPGVIVQAQTANTSGSAESGIAGSTPMLFALNSSEYDIVSALSATSVTAGATPQWDTIGVKLDWASGSVESRSFEAAVGRALTTVSTEKSAYVSATFEIATGIIASTYSEGSLSTGYVALITKKRTSSESLASMSPSDFFYNPYPMRLGIETVVPQNMYIENHIAVAGTNAYHENDSTFPFMMENAGTPASSTEVIAIPSQMHAGCRLVGVGFVMANNSPTSVEIGRVDIPATTGAAVWTQLYDVSAIDAKVGSNTKRGYFGVGETDWLSTAGPIWGNGQGYGPLFSPERQDLSNMDASPVYDYADWSSVGVKATLTNGSHRFGIVRFFYLY